MAAVANRTIEATGQNGEATVSPSPIPRSVTLARRGISTADEALRFTSALIGDAMIGDVKERTAGVALRGVGVMIRLNDTKHRYNEGKDVVLVPAAEDDTARKLELLESELKELRAARQ